MVAIPRCLGMGQRRDGERGPSGPRAALCNADFTKDGPGHGLCALYGAARPIYGSRAGRREGYNSHSVLESASLESAGQSALRYLISPFF